MVLNNYKCGWCNHEFTQEVSFSDGTNNPKTRLPGKRGISSQVQCPKCLMFLKTWSNGKNR